MEKLLNSLYQISEAAHTAKRLPALFEAIHGIVNELMPAKNLYIARYDEKTDRIRFSYSVDEYDTNRVDRKPARGLTEYVLRTKKPLLASKKVFAELVASNELELMGEPTVDWLGVPLITKGKAVGVLAVLTYSESVRYGDEEKNILTFVSEQIAMAIERVQSEEELRRHRDHLEELVRERTEALASTTETLKVEITGREKAEAALKESEQKFHDLLNILPDPAFIIDITGKVIAWNRAIEQLTGVSAGEMLGRGDHEYAIPFYGDPRPILIDLVGQADGEFEKRYPMICKDPENKTLTGENYTPALPGGGRYLYATAGVLQDAQGRAIGAIEVIRDISDRKRMEEELRRAKEYLENVFESSADPIAMVDTQGRFVKWNRMTEIFFGWESKDLYLKSAFELYPDQQQLRDLLNRLRSEGAVRRHETRLFRSDGTIRPVEMSVSLLKDSQGKTIGSVAVVRDLSELKKAMIKVQESERLKTDFLSTVSHELRTPLTSVVGFAKIIRKRYKNILLENIRTDSPQVERAAKQVGENIDIIISEGERLTALINDVLDIAKIEAGRMEWQMVPLSVEDLVRKAAASLTPLFDERKGLALHLEIEEGLPLVQGDRGRLIQVMTNLFSNAAKFTPSGAVTCRVRPERRSVTVSVEDTGIGIQEADLERVFDKFKQVGDTLTDKPKGTGLGLPICREIVEHHGGRIWAEGKPGSGSIFSFTLPSHEAPEQIIFMDLNAATAQMKKWSATGETLPLQQGRTVFILDDDPNIRELIRQVLEGKSYRVAEAGDAKTAIRRIKKQLPDLIILDVKMPDLNGFDVTAVLKSDPGTRHIPIIILSVLSDRKRAADLGVESYLNKPLDPDVLLAEVDRLLVQRAFQNNILVGDGSNGTIHILGDVLDAHGYRVERIDSTPQAFRAAVRAGADMIVVQPLDQNTPKILMRLIREGIVAESVRFIVLTENREAGENRV